MLLLLILLVSALAQEPREAPAPAPVEQLEQLAELLERVKDCDDKCPVDDAAEADSEQRGDTGIQAPVEDEANAVEDDADNDAMDSGPESEPHNL